MTPHDRALELLSLANDDLYVARVLAPDASAADGMVGFHLQQAAEKLLKALLAERNVDYPRTHSLLRLMLLAAEHGYALPGFVDELASLTRYAVVERYEVQLPASSLDRPRLLSLVERLQEWVEGGLG
ncbi:MAG TPA: HEPN domain-containing protein [Chloroflexota bacterium]